MSNMIAAVTEVRITNKGKHPLPQYATPHSAGLDLRANLETPIVLAPGQRALIPTGLYLELPEGTEAQVRPRSGLAFKHGITVLHGHEPFTVNDGERVAQLVVAAYVRVAFAEVDDLRGSDRGTGGFGHTGVR